MAPLELSLLLHQALETRVNRFLALTGTRGWWADAESLHEARVASRRLRSIMRLLDPTLYPGLKRHQKRLERFTELLGEVRELDVQNQILEELGPELPGPNAWAALEHLLELVEQRRSRARKRLPIRVEELELHKLSAILPPPELPYPFRAQEPAELAWSHLEPHLVSMEALVPDLQREEDPASLHQLRIHTKKLRYTLEILSPLFAHPEPPLKELRALQGVLGDHHDYSVMESALQTLLDGLELRSRRVLAEGSESILLLLSMERAIQYDRFREIADLFTPPGFSRGLRERLGCAGAPE